MMIAVYTFPSVCIFTRLKYDEATDFLISRLHEWKFGKSNSTEFSYRADVAELNEFMHVSYTHVFSNEYKKLKV